MPKFSVPSGFVPSGFSKPEEEDIQKAIRHHYHTIREHARKTDETIFSCGWLDIARCVYPLRYREVISKTAAGNWAVNNRIFPEIKI